MKKDCELRKEKLLGNNGVMEGREKPISRRQLKEALLERYTPEIDRKSVV